MKDGSVLLNDPKLNILVRIDGVELRLLGLLPAHFVMVTNHPPFVLYMAAGEDGLPGLLPRSDWTRLVAADRATILPPADARPPVDDAAKVVAQCALLDAAEVPQGNKAIAIWLHLNWSPDLQRRFGAPSNPSTLRRWRAQRRAGMHVGAASEAGV